MRFYLDENFPKTAARLLAERGHETLDIRGTEEEGLHDSDLFLLAQKSQAVFLTTDRDFFHSIPHIYPLHAGVIVVALRQPNRKSILAKLSWLLDHVPTDQLAGRVFLLRDANYLAYPPLEL
jgi:predicted nuclease of predicted toxin-antitoxin system